MRPRENAALGSVTQASFFGGDGLCNSLVFFPKGGFCALTRFLPHGMREGTVSCKREGGFSGTGQHRGLQRHQALLTPYLALFDSPSAPASALSFGSRSEGWSARNGPRSEGWSYCALCHQRWSCLGTPATKGAHIVCPVLKVSFFKVLLTSSFKDFHPKIDTLITWDSATRF